MTELVQREAELAQLDVGLADVLGGDGRALLVSGEAGTGKTSLVDAFVEKAVGESDELVVAVGTCDPQTGVADPYLPFREILQELTGTLESERVSQAGGSENRKRLGKVSSVAGDVLLEFGPDLIGLLVPGASLLAKVGTKAAQKAGLVESVSRKVAGGAGGAASSGLDQNLIFEQYVNVIRGIAAQRPLVLVIDDLQWADTASIQLLFRLGRRLTDVKLMVIGTYRPNDVAAGRDDDRHPLEPVVGELQRYLGDIVVGLDQSDPGVQREFVDALLDNEPNTFDEPFRNTFWERTSGHPLFSAELLRGLKQTGQVVLDGEFRWSATDELDWRSVPGRVDGLIGERVRRLPPDLRELLRRASVEGDTFAVEVLAYIQQVEPRALVPVLSEDLQRTHMLVEAVGVDWAGDQSLSRYRFANKQIHQQVYGGLDAVELSYAHREAAQALEHLYADGTSEVAVDLAYHYIRAGNRPAAAQYLLDAATRAKAGYANDEALALVEQGLELVDYEDRAMRWELLLLREDISKITSNREQQAEDLAELDVIAEFLSDDTLRLEVALLRVNFLSDSGEFEQSLELSHHVMDVATKLDDPLGVSRASVAAGSALIRLGRVSDAESPLRIALATAHEHGLTEQQMMANQMLSSVDFGRKNHTESKAHLEEALQSARQLGNRRAQATIHQNLGITALALCDYDYCRSQFSESLKLAEAMGFRDAIAAGYASLGEADRLDGNFENALVNSERALALAIESNSAFWIAVQHRAVADALIELGRADEAEAEAIQAVEHFRELGSMPALMDCIATLVRAQRGTGDLERAADTCEEAVQFLLDDGDIMVAAYPFLVYATCLDLLKANDDQRFDDVLAQALHQLDTHYPNGGCLPWMKTIGSHRPSGE